METKRIVGISFSILFMLVFTFCVIWVTINWNTVKDSLSGTQLYTEEDLTDAYQDGYDTAFAQKETYEALINSYRDTITTLSSRVTTLTSGNSDYATLVDNLNDQINDLEDTVAGLTTSGANYIETISTLNEQITALQSSIAYYVEYLSNLTADTYVVATFEVEGSVYSVVLVDPNATTNVANPESTTYKEFEYWTVEGVQVNLSTYVISEDTTFEAVFAYSYDVTFWVDGEIYVSDIVGQNGHILATSPEKADYSFAGWSLNGNIVNTAEIPITTNTNYVAVWAEILPYVCDTEGNLLHYIGNETNVSIPKTYSLGVYVEDYVLVQLDTEQSYQQLMGSTYQDYDFASQAWVMALGYTGLNSASDIYNALVSIGSYNLPEYSNYHCSLITGDTCYFEITIDYYEVISGDDYSVTNISVSAFNVLASYTDETANNIISVYIPNTVLTIEDKAFYQMKNLTTVEFEENSKLTTIGNYAFAWTPKLESFIAPTSVTFIGEACFSGCSKLGYIELGSITIINTYTIWTNTAVVIIIPETVTTISTGAFIASNNYSLTIYMPDSVTSIADDAFSNTYTIIIDADKLAIMQVRFPTYASHMISNI